MEKYDGSYLRMGIALIATIFHFMFGGWSMALASLIALVIVDFLSGLWVAKRAGAIDSKVGKWGAVVKCLYFVLIFVMRRIDQGLGLPVPALQTLATWNLIIAEGESIIENLAALGVPIHESIRKSFKRLKEREHDIQLP